MQISVLLALIYVAGFVGLATLLVLETDLCPQALRRLLAKRSAPAPATLEEKEAKQAAHSLRLKRLRH
jgi:hypothetical protein